MKSRNCFLFLLLSLAKQRLSVAFLEARPNANSSTKGPLRESFYPTLLYVLNPSTDNDLLQERTELPISSQQLRDEIKYLCKAGKVFDAAVILEKAEISLVDSGSSDLWPEESCYVTILKALTRESNSQSTMMADNIIERMTENSENGKGHPPTAQAYNAAICVWAVSNRNHAASRCCEYLDNLWSLYDKTKDKRFVPLRSSYISTIDALSRTRKGFEGATQAERLLEDMENFSQEHSSLTPNTICFNAVL